MERYGTIYVYTAPTRPHPEDICHNPVFIDRVGAEYLQLARDVGIYTALWGVGLDPQRPYDEHMYIRAGRLIGILSRGLHHLSELTTDNSQWDDFQIIDMKRFCERYLTAMLTNPDHYALIVILRTVVT